MRRTSIFAIVIGGVLLRLAPFAVAQKSSDTVRIGFNDPLNTVDMDFDPKPESNFVARATAL